MAKAEAVEQGAWVNGPFYFEQAVEGVNGKSRSIKACITTSPEGQQFVSVREWGTKADGTEFFTRNGMLVPVGNDKLRDAFMAALSAVPAAAKPAKAPAKKKAK